MIPFSLSELKQATQCQILTPREMNLEKVMVYKVVTSSGDADGYSLFIPLKGERFDAHSFVLDAIAHGCRMIATSKTKEELIAMCNQKNACARVELEELLESVVLCQCNDTLRFLGLCGQLVRRKCHATVGAITGSCGKTTVKEMSAAILQHCGETLYTNGNFNNDVGVPLTLLRLGEEHTKAVIEQGASHLQDIARTAEFVEPEFALINNAGEAHIAGFGSREGVYKGKSEILDELFGRKPEALAAVCADSPWFERWTHDYQTQYQNKQLLSFGESEQATIQITQVEEHEGTVSCHLFSHDARFPLDIDVCLQTLGRHNVLNAAAAALLSLLMGATEKEVKLGLESWRGMQGRLAPLVFKDFTLIDDAYNASYNAVISAIDTLSSFKGYRIFIFGDMGELGNAEVELHKQVGEHAQKRIDLLLCVGPLAQYSVQAMGQSALHFAQHDALIQYVESAITKHSADGAVTCLVKGSHAMHMDKIVAALKAFAGRQA